MKIVRIFTRTLPDKYLHYYSFAHSLNRKNRRRSVARIGNTCTAAFATTRMVIAKVKEPKSVFLPQQQQIQSTHAILLLLPDADRIPSLARQFFNDA